MVARFSFILLLTILLGSCAQKQEEETSGPSKVEVVKEGNKFRLTVDGETYTIKGAGLEFGSISELAEHGGNTFRTWRTDNGQRSAIEILDEADSLGVKVLMGIEVGRERHGFDYNDLAAVQEQLESIKEQVLALKDHPALLMWGIGNELNLRATNPKVWDAVNDISKMIHEVDPNHPTTTSLAGISKELVIDIKERAADLDILSVQFYGDIVNLPKYIDEYDWTGPYMITEWGATGHWEVATTEWNAPIENNSTVKANSYYERYKTAIEPELDQCIGSFVFLWGQKQERTPTWYGVYLEDGSETASVDVMHKIWTGSYPENQSPAIDSIRLENKSAYSNIYLKPGMEASAQIWASDVDGDEIRYEWVVMKESTDLQDGGDFETTPEPIEGIIKDATTKSITLIAPEETGPYRLFLYAYDNMGHAAHANIPFFVQ